jgi:hypothetical protein
MNTHYLTHVPQAHGGARTPGWGIALVCAILSLLLVPNMASAQAPSPEEALDVVADYVRYKTWVVGEWHLGVDAVRTSQQHPNAVASPSAHRQILSRVAEAKELPFYAGEDFGRVICDASPDPEQAAANCRFAHGTRSMLMLTVVSSDEETGITRVEAFSAVAGDVPHWHDGEVWTGWNTHTITLEVEYATDRSPQLGQGRSFGIFRSGNTPVDEIRSSSSGH